MLKKLLAVAVVATLALTIALPPPQASQAGAVQLVDVQDEAMAAHAVYTAPVEAPQLVTASAPIERVELAADKRSNGNDRRSRSDSATAAFVDTSQRYPLNL